MNLVKLRDIKLMHRNLLHSYTLAISEREIKKTIPIVAASKLIYPRNKFNQGDDRSGH